VCASCRDCDGRDLERCALRPGNVHSADGWDGVLKPVVARYQGKVSRIGFRIIARKGAQAGSGHARAGPRLCAGRSTVTTETRLHVIGAPGGVMTGDFNA